MKTSNLQRIKSSHINGIKMLLAAAFWPPGAYNKNGECVYYIKAAAAAETEEAA